MKKEPETREQEISKVIQSFQIDVTDVTIDLINTLWSINTLYRQEKGQQAPSYPNPDYPKLKVLPRRVADTPFSDRFAPKGPMEQLIFKAWVTDVYDRLWEGTYRNKLREEFQTPNRRKPRMEANVLGDFKNVRHDLIHNKSIAKDSATCEVLHWFKKGEHMSMRMGHVFDFLNQMAMIPDLARPIHGDGTVLWLPDSTTYGSSEVIPALVSVRPLIFETEEFQYRYCASIVFEDGVFAKIPFEFAEHSKITDDQWVSIRIIEDKELFIPPDAKISSVQLYQTSFGPTMKGPGNYTPPLRL